MSTMLLAADFCLPTLLTGLLDLSRVAFARWPCAGPLGAKSRIVGWLSVFGIELLEAHGVSGVLSSLSRRCGYSFLETTKESLAWCTGCNGTSMSGFGIGLMGGPGGTFSFGRLSFTGVVTSLSDVGSWKPAV